MVGSSAPSLAALSLLLTNSTREENMMEKKKARGLRQRQGKAEGAPGHGWAMGSLSWGAIQLSSPQQGLELDGLKSLLQPESFYGHSPVNVTGTTDLV